MLIGRLVVAAVVTFGVVAAFGVVVCTGVIGLVVVVVTGVKGFVVVVTGVAGSVVVVTAGVSVSDESLHLTYFVPLVSVIRGRYQTVSVPFSSEMPCERYSRLPEVKLEPSRS